MGENSDKFADDDYWLVYGEKQIRDTVEVRNNAAGNLEKLTLWFWAIYTTFFTIGATTQTLDVSGAVLFMMALPIVLLIITYWLSVWVRLPTLAKFDPMIPSEIRDSFNENSKTKGERLRKAIISALLSAISVAVALFLLSLSKKKDIEEPYLRTEVKPLESSTILAISGTFPKDKSITIFIDTFNIAKGMYPYDTLYFKSQTGVFVYDVNLHHLPNEASINAIWEGEEKEQMDGITQRVKLKKK